MVQDKAMVHVAVFAVAGLVLAACAAMSVTAMVYIFHKSLRDHFDGEKGPAGPAGPAGPTGPAGPAGSAAATVIPDATIQWNAADSSFESGVSSVYRAVLRDGYATLNFAAFTAEVTRANQHIVSSTMLPTAMQPAAIQHLPAVVTRNAASDGREPMSGFITIHPDGKVVLSMALVNGSNHPVASNFLGTGHFVGLLANTVTYKLR